MTKAGLFLALLALSCGAAAAGPSVSSVGLARGAVQVSPGSSDQVSPAWSFDGKRLAWVQRKAAGSGTFNLFVKQVGSTEPAAQITQDSDNVSAYSGPVWSPDGRFVGFVTTDGFHRTASAAGSGVSTSVAIGQTCLRGVTGRVALGGRHYLVERRGSNIALLQLGADGTFAPAAAILVTGFDPSVTLGDVRPTADYATVVFAVNSGTTSRLYALRNVQSIVSGQSAPPSQLTSPAILPLTNAAAFDALGGPNPDSGIIFVSSTGSFTPRADCVPNSDTPGSLFGPRNFEITVVAGDGSGQRAPISGLQSVQNEVFPALSPDGMRLAFVRDDGGVFQLFTADLAFQATIASTGGSRVATDASGTTVTLPSGALPGSTTLFISAPSTIPDAAGLTLPSGVRPVVVAREIASTGGISLSSPATIRFSYQPSQIAGLTESTLSVFFFNAATQRWELAGGTVDTAARQVVFQTAQLGTFGLAGMVSAPAPAPGGGSTPAVSAGGGGGGSGCAMAGPGIPFSSALPLLAPLALVLRQRRISRPARG